MWWQFIQFNYETNITVISLFLCIYADFFLRKKLKMKKTWQKSIHHSVAFSEKKKEKKSKNNSKNLLGHISLMYMYNTTVDYAIFYAICDWIYNLFL